MKWILKLLGYLGDALAYLFSISLLLGFQDSSGDKVSSLRGLTFSWSPRKAFNFSVDKPLQYLNQVYPNVLLHFRIGSYYPEQEFYVPLLFRLL